MTLSAAHRLLVWGVACAALVACNRPKQRDEPGQSPAATRSQSIATREQAERSASASAGKGPRPQAASPQAAAPPAESTTSSLQPSVGAMAQGPGSFSAIGSNDACTLSLAGAGWLVDCGFHVCPKEFVAGLLLSDSVVLEGLDAGWELVAERSLPPRQPISGVRLETSGSRWILTGLQAGQSACSVAGVALAVTGESTELPVESLGIRSNVQARPQNDR